MNTNLVQLLEHQAKQLSHDFQKASIEGGNTPQEVSDRRENTFNDLISSYFPFPYRITKQSIIDSFGNRSQSIDCLVLNPCHPYTVSNNSLLSIVFADGVDFAIELKPELSSKKEIERALEQIISVKKLKRVKNSYSTMNPQDAPEIYSKIPCFIFANSTYKNKNLLVKYIVEFYVKNSIPREHQFDMIVINNDLVLENCRNSNSYFSNTSTEGITAWNLGNKCLLYMIMILNTFPKVEIVLGENLLSLYLNREELCKMYPVLHSFKELNKKLVALG
jgi:hypothetical protein